MSVGFRLGSIPIRVHGVFFLMALFLGANQHQPARLVIWVAVVFVSVLVHELGHALVGKAFGLAPQIDLHGMGGLTSWKEGKPLGNGKSVAVSLAGPFAGFAFGAVLLVAARLGLRPVHPLAVYAFETLLAVNIAWGVFNLLPMLPLDGGNVMRSIFASVLKARAEKAARGVSLAVAVGIALLAVTSQQWWILGLAVLYAFSNLQALRQGGRVEADRVLSTSIQGAHAALENQDGKTAAALLRPALLPGASPELRSVGTRMLAYALLLESEWPELLQLLDANASLVGDEDLARFSRTARGLGRTDEADRIDALVRKPALGEFRA